jgi:diguanylate cyclase (GGDEF)-like protein/PAS domain S-box-containing protein
LASNVALALGYLALAWPAQRVFPHIATFWPPAALAVLAAMRGGWRAMPGIALGSLLVNLMLFHWSVPLSTAVALGNCAAPLLGRAGMRRYALDRDSLWAHPPAVAAFLFWMGPVQGAVAALSGIGALYAAGRVAAGGAWALTLGWATGDACAALMLVPALHQLWVWRAPRRSPSAQPGYEVAGVFVVSALLWAVVFLAPGLVPAVRFGLLGLLLLPSLWSVFRLDARVSHALLAAVFVLVLGATLRGYGPFAGVPLDDASSGVELLGIAMACGVLLGGALQSQRRRAMAELREINAELDCRAEERAQALLQQERRFHAMIEALPAPALVIDLEGRVLYANPAAIELVGGGALIGEDFAARCDAAGRALLTQAGQADAARQAEIRLSRADGGSVALLGSVTAARIDGRDVLLLACKDISERVERELALRTQADTDALTGLNNRRYFMRAALPALRALRGSGRGAALMLIDLDDFKQVNDRWGHDCGDRVLQHTSAWLRSQLRHGDLLARLGGEEFVMLLRDVGAAQAARHGELLRAGLDGRVVRAEDGRRVPQPSLSIGVALAQPDADADPETLLAALLREADQALYAAKAQGKNRVVVAAAAVRAGAAAPQPRAAARSADGAALGQLSLQLLRDLVREANLGRFFEQVAYAAAHLVGADGVAFLERDGDALQLRFFEGWPTGPFHAGMRLPSSAGTAARALRENRVLFCADYALHPDALPTFAEHGLRANLLLPVGDAEQPGGVLALSWFGQAPQCEPDAAQYAAAGLLAELLGAALRREALERDLRRQALLDPGSGLPNRIALEAHFERALARARRAGERLLLVRAQAAHEADVGALAATLQGAVREADFVAGLEQGTVVAILEGDDDGLDVAWRRLCAALDVPLGRALCPDEGSALTELLRRVAQTAA